MAHMIPDYLASNASQGERNTFELLKRLPDSDIVYYEPCIRNRYPDFIVISPNWGILIIEVKGWRASEIVEGNLNDVLVNSRTGPAWHKHPLRQARDYMWRLAQECQSSLFCSQLLHKDGPHQGRFIFPFGHMVVLSNITDEQLNSETARHLRPLFPSDRVLTRNSILNLKDKPGAKISEVLLSYFDPFWPIAALSESQITALRCIIHPEVQLSPPAYDAKRIGSSQTQTNIKALDLEQEKNARSIGQGHRVIHGVAGSGKTILLISRARYLSAAYPHENHLVLCFNKALAAYLRVTLANHANVLVRNFHKWGHERGVVPRQYESPDLYGARLFSRLSDLKTKRPQYQSILIDEAQDFVPVWYKCILLCLKDSQNGDLLIVGDSNQGLYHRHKISWKELGVHARGRTISKRFHLDRNYRNTREIVSVAALFARQSIDEEDDFQTISIDPAKAVRQSGQYPVLAKSETLQQESQQILSTVKGLLEGLWNGDKRITPLQPGEIAILYPMLPPDRHKERLDLWQSLADIAPTTWLSDGSQHSEDRVCENTVKIQTIHSSKGLQYKAVIIIWTDLLPNSLFKISEQDQRNLLYVALTRPEDYLMITYTGKSTFLQELERLQVA